MPRTKESAPLVIQAVLIARVDVWGERRDGSLTGPRVRKPYCEYTLDIPFISSHTQTMRRHRTG